MAKKRARIKDDSAWTGISDSLKDGERVYVIVSASKMELLLEEILLRFLNPSAAKSLDDDELFGRDRPLSTFSAKIRMTARLGIIDADFARILHTIRDIRNDCAHSVEPINLNQPPYTDKVDQLVSYFAGHAKFKKLFDDGEKRRGRRQWFNFEVCGRAICKRLSLVMHDMKPISTVPVRILYPTSDDSQAAP